MLYNTHRDRKYVSECVLIMLTGALLWHAVSCCYTVGLECDSFCVCCFIQLYQVNVTNSMLSQTVVCYKFLRFYVPSSNC